MPVLWVLAQALQQGKIDLRVIVEFNNMKHFDVIRKKRNGAGIS
jgi:hypothetical protein